MKRALVYSISFHLLIIFLLIGYVLHHHARAKNKGDIMQAHLIIEPVALDIKKQHLQKSKKSLTSKVRQKKNTLTKVSTSILNKKTNNAALPRKGKAKSLLIKLHNSIQAQINTQAYRIPDFLRNRNAKVCFTLFPLGQLKAINMAKSSQVPMLDRLAIQSVRAIQPFVPAQYYLQQAQRFCVLVEFK